MGCERFVALWGRVLSYLVEILGVTPLSRNLRKNSPKASRSLQLEYNSSRLLPRAPYGVPCIVFSTVYGRLSVPLVRLRCELSLSVRRSVGAAAAASLKNSSIYQFPSSDFQTQATRDTDINGRSHLERITSVPRNWPCLPSLRRLPPPPPSRPLSAAPTWW